MERGDQIVEIDAAPAEVSENTSVYSSAATTSKPSTLDPTEPPTISAAPPLRASAEGAPSSRTDPTNTTSDDWTLANNIRYILQSAEDQHLPPLVPKTSVLFRNLRVRGAGAGATYLQDVGESFLGPVKSAKGLISHGKQPEKVILHSFDGVVKHGEMLLVLGRPGSGCSTLLKSLAGYTEGFIGWDGEVKYNGVDIETIRKRFRADVVYNSEVDTHFPYLTVEQTLKFAAGLRIPRTRLQGESRTQYVDQMTNIIATTLGLRHTLKTRVGDDYVRGVSGGERKRVSLGEMLASRAAVAYWDNPTRGLDASTSLEFAQAVRTTTDLLGTTAIVALYQSGENLAQQFNKVTLLYLGRQIFFGTLSDARTHFVDLGFLHKPRQTTADFLTAITDPTGRRVREGWENKAPRTPDEFAKHWKESIYYQCLQEEIRSYDAEFGQGQAQLEEYKEIQGTQKAKYQRPGSPYIVNGWMQLGSTLTRAYQRMFGDKIYLASTFFSAIFTSLINGSVFYNVPENTNGFFSKGGVIFFSVLFNSLQTLSEVSTQYAQRPIVEKQKSYGMYHPFIDSLSSMFADWPFKFFNILLFDVIVYFLVGLKQDAAAFFIFLLMTYISTLAVSGLFRTVAALTKQVEIASGIAGIIVLAMSIYAGYIIPVPSMHPWFKWLSYINPLSYAFESLMANEFHGKSAPCAGLIPSGPGYGNAVISQQVCAVTGAVPGLSFVSGDAYIAASFDYHYSHLWRNVGIVCAYVIFFVFTNAVATEFNPPAPGKGEFLIFRKGHEPEEVKKALESGRPVDDPEQGDYEVLTGVKTNISEVHGLVKSKDVFTWENVCYDIPLPGGETRRLLNDITGYVKPGTLTALMGESGAGKTTLLNVLAERTNIGVITGQTLVNGSPPGHSFQRRTGYVQQQDLHLAESTVREALRFSALLRQPKEVPLEEKYEYVEKVIEMLEMQEYAEAVIGSPGNGLNVEQRKRTTIGVELVAKPALLLFLDEPTSGLDSQSAWSIVRFMRKLANSGQAILCTIHQPSSVLFEQFDRLLLLKKGGKTVYFGDIGHNSRDVINHFERNGAFECPPDANPAEYILDVIGAGATAHTDRDWHDIWMKTPDQKEVIQETQELKEEYSREVGDDDFVVSEKSFAASWFTQYKKVQARIFQNYWRNPGYILSKIALNVVAGLFLGFTFYKERNSVQGVQNKLFAIFMAIILAMPLMNQLQPRWDELSSLYLIREKPSKMYHWSTLVLSNIIAEIPYNFVCGTLFFFPWYFATGFSHDYPSDRAARGAYMWVMVMVFETWWSTFGQAVAAMSPNPQTAATLTTVFASFVITFSGVLQPLRLLTNFWHWMYYLSPFTWLVSGLMSNAVHAVDIVCASKEINRFSPPSGQTCGEYAGAFVLAATGRILNPDATAGCEYCRYSTGDQYLATVNMAYSDKWRNFGFMVAYTLFNIAAAFLFYYLTKIASVNFGAFFTKGKKAGKGKEVERKALSRNESDSSTPVVVEK